MAYLARKGNHGVGGSPVPSLTQLARRMQVEAARQECCQEPALQPERAALPNRTNPSQGEEEAEERVQARRLSAAQKYARIQNMGLCVCRR